MKFVKKKRNNLENVAKLNFSVARILNLSSLTVKMRSISSEFHLKAFEIQMRKISLFLIKSSVGI